MATEPHLKIVIQPIGRVVQAGSEFRCKVFIKSEEDVDIRSIEASLYCIEGIKEKKELKRIVHWRETKLLAQEGIIRKDHPLAFKIEFQIPDNALPSAEGLRAHVHWCVETTVEDASGRVGVQRMPITVYNVPKSFEGRVFTEILDSINAQVKMNPIIARGTYTGGELTLYATKDIELAGIKVELVTLEETWNSRRTLEVLFKRTFRISDDKALKSGETEKCDFNIPILPEIPPSYNGKHSRIRSYLILILERRGVDDYQILVPLWIF